jgi:hypothetical protein
MCSAIGVCQRPVKRLLTDSTLFGVEILKDTEKSVENSVKSIATEVGLFVVQQFYGMHKSHFSYILQEKID